MPDEVDRAQVNVDAFTANAIAAARRPYMGPSPVIIDDIECCADCRIPLSPARLAAMPGIGLCVECKEDREER